MRCVTEGHVGVITAVLAVIIMLLIPCPAKAHCDTMDGPVVRDARKALETGNVNLVLNWVQKQDETEIKTAFDKTMAVRKLGPQAIELADKYFFETLVRIHRAGEGAPYTGLKPAGTVVDPALAAADAAIENGTVDELVEHLNEVIRDGILLRFEELKSRQNYDKNDVDKGREFVESYVVFIHYVERLFNDANPAESEHAH